MKNGYGLQLYSVRDVTERDLEGALDAVASLGYSSVEFAGFFGHGAKEVRAMLDRSGLKISGTHSGLDELRPTRIGETLRYYTELGCPHYIVPWTKPSSLEEVKDICSVLNFAQPLLAAEGIKLGYHNHSHELALMPWGSTVLSEFERNTDIGFEIDIFWAYHAGADPVELIERLKDRIDVIHMKDGFADGRGVPLGEGEAPVKAVFDNALKNGFEMVVESETLSPSGLDEAERCIKYLRSIE